MAAALLRATSLPFIVAAEQIGMELGAVSGATAAALVAAGLLSVLIFSLVALTVRGGDRALAESERPRGMVEWMRSET